MFLYENVKADIMLPLNFEDICYFYTVRGFTSCAPCQALDIRSIQQGWE